MRLRLATIRGLGITLSACGLSTGGLDPNVIQPVEASTPMEPPDAGPEPVAPRDAEAIVEAAVDASAPIDPCPVHGTFALTLEADVHWEGTRLFGIVPIIVPGDGKVAVQTLVSIAPEGPAHPVTVRACGAKLPDFAASIGEVYGADIPAEVWDGLSLRWNTQAHFGCASSGCAFTTDPVTAQLGIGIPANAAWPSPRDTIPDVVQRDDDGDGLPGIRLRMRGPMDGPAYEHPPTSFLLLERVSEIQLAIRVGATLDGTLTSCETREGTTSAMTLDIRALACRLDDDTPCDDSQLGFIDDNLPVWTVQTATFRAARLPTNATCADVRALP
ncbi:MAG: hypothetical protein ABW352_02705 [Polyangiales bacterium]